MASSLLKPGGYERYRQNAFSALLSQNATRLTVNLASVSILDVLSQLTGLISLKTYGDMDLWEMLNKDYSGCVLKIPSLQRLSMSGIYARDLTVQCPQLRTLHIGLCHITESPSLQAPVEEFTLRLTTVGGLDMPRGIFGILPSMSSLRTLEFHSPTGKLPPLLPASLRVVRYIMEFPRCFYVAELQHLPAACQLPEVQSVCLHHLDKWMPKELSAIQEHAKESKASVVVKDDWADETDASGETFY